MSEQLVGGSLEGVTLFCASDEPGLLLRVLAEHGADVRATPSDWARSSFVFSTGSMSLRRDPRAPDSDFSRVVLGMLNHVRTRLTTSKEQAKAVGRPVATAKVLVGISFDPPVASTADPRWDCVLAMAHAASAALFDGFAMLDHEGHIIAAPPKDPTE